jgi:serine kinase
MPVSGDTNKRPQSPSGARKSSNATKPAKEGGAGAGNQPSGQTKGSTQEIPHHLKRRGVATPGSMMALHRRGYILDGGNTLGSGAYAKVKVGTALKMNQQVAIKIVNKLSTPKEVVERFLPREIETMKAVDNEHIVKLYEVIETPETIFFIMELADRGDLLDFINERKYLSERLARGFFSDLVKGIDHCHTRGVVHRDLKCENLLLDSHMRLKISDFGFARKFNGNLRTFCGSFAYAAPEVILGNPYNGPLADIWSMGVILYAMVTGRLPFKDTSTSVLMADIAAGVKFSPRHTDKLRSLVTKILTFLPHDRADMALIQGHPWLNIPLTLNFPSIDEKTAHAVVQADRHAGTRRASNPPPRTTKERSSGYVTGSPDSSVTEAPSGPQSNTRSDSIPKDPPKQSTNPKKDSQTLHVPEAGQPPGPGGTDAINNSLSASFPAKCGSDRSRSKSLPSGGLDIPLPTRSKFAENIDGEDEGKKRERSSSISKGGSPEADSLSCVSGQSSGENSKVVSRVLNTKNPFHSVSRYERRGSNTSDVYVE